MLLHRRDFNRAGLLTAQWVRELPFTLFVLFAVSFATNLSLEKLSRVLYYTEQGPWPAQIAQMFCALLEGFFLLLIGGFFLVNLREKMSWRIFFKKYMAPLTAESLRAITRILLWCLVFLVPGMIMYCRLNFVPFVVFADPSYATRPDAVARTLELTRSCWFKITLIIFGLGCFDAIFEFAPHILNIEDFGFRLFFELCGFLFSLFSFVLLYMIFQNLMQTQEKGS